jgi:pimeloyl-ACP methyl ester carboxylesterase
MDKDHGRALRDVFTTLVGGDDELVTSALNRLGADPLERFATSAALLDLSLPFADVIAQAEEAGDWAAAPLVRLLSESRRHVVLDETAAVLLGPLTDTSDPRLGRNGSAIVFRLDAVTQLLALDFPDLPLTQVEQRILFHLLAGLDLRDMAMLDGVGYETRRGQFKALAAKLGISRQIDIVRLLLGRMLVLLGQRPRNDTAHALFFEETGDPRYGGGRPFTMLGPDGVQLRAVEVGQRQGTPVIILHPQASPLLSAMETQALEAEGLRTLWPLRDGALAPSATALPLPTQRARSLAAIRTTHEMFCQGPVPLVGLISGAPYAIEAALAMPERFSRLIIVGACHAPSTAGPGPGALRRGLYWIARHSPSFLGVALGLLAAQISRPGAYVRAMRNHHADSPADLAIIEQATRDRQMDRMQARYCGSLGAIRNDFLFQTIFDWSKLSDVSIPVHFIHGAEDPVHSAKQIAALADTLPHASLDVIPGAGQLLLLQHMLKVIRLLGAKVREVPR